MTSSGFVSVSLTAHLQSEAVARSVRAARLCASGYAASTHA